ncbi:hypothetical protein VTO42DRAFT_2805 [Malbranchea cinnamomea]
MWYRDLCEHPSTRGANTANLFTEEEFSEAAWVRVTKAKLSSDIHWELNCSSKVIEIYSALRSEASHLKNILKDQKKLEAPRDKGLNRKFSDHNLKKQDLLTSQDNGASQKDNLGVQKDSKRPKGEGKKLSYDRYLTCREKGFYYVYGGPGHKSSGYKTVQEKDSKLKDSKHDSFKDAPTSGYKAYMAGSSSLSPVRPQESKMHMFEIDIVVMTASGIEHSLRAMMDSGADVSFISHKLVR